jgi:lactoylglutathione lyase
MKLNHMGLGITDVIATVEMFEKYFGLSRAPGAPSNAKMAFLTDDDGSLITLFKSDDVIYPKIFHIGFMLGSVEQVAEMHDRITAGGFQPEKMRKEHGRITFYFNAPGGFVVEVNSLAQHPSADLMSTVNPNNA